MKFAMMFDRAQSLIKQIRQVGTLCYVGWYSWFTECNFSRCVGFRFNVSVPDAHKLLANF